MAYYDFDPSLDFEAQEQEMLQAAARIKALRGMKAPDIEQPEGFKSAVTGAGILAPTVRKRALGQLVPVIADYTAGQQEKELNTQRARMSQAQQDALASWIKGTPQPTEEALGPTEPTGAFTGDQASILSAIQGIADPNERAAAFQGYRNQLQGNKRTVAPTRAQVLEHAAVGMKNPLSKTLAAQYLSDQLVKEPEREEAKAARLHERTMSAEAARAKQQEDIAFRRSEGEMNRQNRLDVVSAVAAGRTPPRTQLTPAGVNEKGQPMFIVDGDPNKVITGPGVKTAEKVAKALPAAQSKAWIENETNMKKIDRVIADLESPAGQEATGKKGYVGQIPGVGQDILNALDPEGVNTRAGIADVGTLEVHQRSGATVTAAEYPRLKPFIPLPTDPPDVAAKKLKRFKQEYESVQQEILDYAEAMGYKSPKVDTAPAPAAAAPAAPGYDPRAAFLAAQEAYMKDPSKANEQAVRNAESDVLRSQSTPEAPAAPPANVRRRKWNPQTKKLE